MESWNVIKVGSWKVEFFNFFVHELFAQRNGIPLSKMALVLSPFFFAKFLLRQISSTKRNFAAIFFRFLA